MAFARLRIQAGYFRQNAPFGPWSPSRWFFHVPNFHRNPGVLRDGGNRDEVADYEGAACNSPLPSRDGIPRSLKISSFRRSDRSAAIVAFTTFA